MLAMAKAIWLRLNVVFFVIVLPQGKCRQGRSYHLFFIVCILNNKQTKPIPQDFSFNTFRKTCTIKGE